MTEPADTNTRSTLNRLASLAAGQEQLQADMTKLRGDVKALLILGAYGAALALMTFLALRYGKGAVTG